MAKSEKLIQATINSCITRCIIGVAGSQLTVNEFIGELYEQGWDEEELVRIETEARNALKERAKAVFE